MAYFPLYWQVPMTDAADERQQIFPAAPDAFSIFSYFSRIIARDSAGAWVARGRQGTRCC